MKKSCTMPHQDICLGTVFWRTVILATLLISIVGCDSRKPIKVGFVGGLTGQLADLGTAGRNGVMLAVEEVNEAGGIQGRPIALITKDDQQNPETAVAVDRELIKEGVTAIIGHMTSTMSIAVLSVINEAEMLMISPTTSSNQLSGFDDYFLRLVPPYDATTRTLAQYAFQQMGLRRVAIIYDLSNEGFSQMAYDNFRSEFEGLGAEIMHAETFIADPDINYVKLADALLQTDPDGVLIVGGALDTAMLCQHIRIQGSTIPILASGWAGLKELVQFGGSAVEGLSFVMTENTRHELFLSFQTRFRERFGDAPDFAAAYGYEAAQILFDALSLDDDPATLKDTILRHKTFPGVQGEITFDRYGDPSRQHFIVSIQNGDVNFLE